MCGGPNETIYEYVFPRYYHTNEYNNNNNNNNSRSSDRETTSPGKSADPKSEAFQRENRADGTLGFRVRFSVNGKSSRLPRRGDKFLCCDDGAMPKLRANGTIGALPTEVSRGLREKIGKNTVEVHGDARLNVTVKIAKNSAFAIDRQTLPEPAETPADPSEKRDSSRRRGFAGERKRDRKRPDGSPAEQLSNAKTSGFPLLSVAVELKCRIIRRPEK